jgi:TolB protein
MARPGPAIILLLALLALAIVGAALLSVGTTSPAGAVHNGLIAFDSGGDIMVAEPDGSDIRPLIAGPTSQVGPSWSPDGKRIAYFERVSGDGGLGPGSFDETDAYLVRVADADAANDHDVTGGETYRLTGAPGSGIRWSPDATRIAFTVATPDGLSSTTSTIAVAMADGSEARLLPLDVDAEDPVWDPGGDLLAFRAPPDVRPDRTGIWMVRPDGSDARRVIDTFVSGAEGYAFMAPLWSASGDSLVYGCCDFPHDIWISDAEGGDPHAITTDPVDEYWPAWSPDGTRVAFQRQTNPSAPENDIIVLPRDGTDEQRVDIESTGGIGPLVWSPDGRLILGYTSYSEDLVIATIDGSQPPVSIPAPDISYFGTVWSWQPVP